MTGRAATSGTGFALDLSGRDFRRIADVMRRDTGIELPENKLPLVQSRIIRRLRALNLNDFQSYCDLIEQSKTGTERLEMLSALTTNITGFFRENHHFEYLRETCIPQLAEAVRAGRPVRIWSAGCSTGEEPYSLGLTFLDAVPDLSQWDFKILATDIDPAVLTMAINGYYSVSQLEKVPKALRERFFLSASTGRDEYQVRPELRDLITFRRLNMIENWPMSKSFDVIVCRNVVIYFGEETKSDIWTRLAQKLVPGGILITGHSERLSGPAACDMRLVSTTTYQHASPGSDTKRNATCR